MCLRVLFVLAEHGDAPKGLIELNRRRMPVRSVLLCSAAGVTGILAAVKASQGVFAFLVDASGALMVFVYMMTALAHIRLRRSRERAGDPPPSITLRLFPRSSYVAIAAMIAVLVAMAFTPGLGLDLYASLITLAAAACAGYGVLLARRCAIHAPIRDTTNGTCP